jgi:twitching motility protein PilT
MARLDYILRLMASEEADGLDLRVGQPPALVYGRTSKHLGIPAFSEKQLRGFVREIATPEDLASLHKEGAAVLHYEFQDKFFSCNLTQDQKGLRASFRAHGTDRTDENPLPVAASSAVGVQDISLLADDETQFSPPDAGPSWSMDFEGQEASPTGGLRPRAHITYTRSEATQPPVYGAKISRDEVNGLLRWMVEQDATDLHLTPRFPPTLRVDNLFQPSQGRELTPEELEKVIFSILSEEDRRTLEAEHSVDLSYQVEGLGRFRVNVFRQMYGVSAAIRYIRSAIESLEELNLPTELTWLTGQENGLVLFTGPTGSGKSTTMAAIIEQMNKTRQLHILTLEAPIEFLFTNDRCLIQQREVGTHTDTFNRGLKDALRENPDVIMVGELRDLDTVQMALSASETGHLILATLHANSSTNAISRLIDVFPDTQKAGARTMVSDVLRAVVNLRLLRHKSGRGLVPTVEFLKNNAAVSTLIRENKLHQVRQVITTAGGEGMWPFERHLVELFRRGQVEYEVAYAAAPDKKVFEQFANSGRPASGRRSKR